MIELNRDKFGRILKLNLNEKEIIRLYQEEKISSSEIALIVGCSSKTIQNRLKSFGIKLSYNRPPVSLDTKQKLRESHKGKKLSPEHRLKSIETLRRYKEKITGKTRVEVYGKEKADEWKKNQSLAASGEKNVHFGKKLLPEHKQKISNSLKGKMPKNLEQINKNKTGEGNPMYGKFGKLSGNYIHGEAYAPYPSIWNKNLKNKIRNRDNQVCMNCGIHREKLKKSLDVHHLDYNKEICIPQNLISLCHTCHMITNNNREYWKKLFQEKLSHLYSYEYLNGKIIINIQNAL